MFSKKTTMLIFTLALLHSPSLLISQGRQVSEDVADLSDESVESKLFRAVSAALTAGSDIGDLDDLNENEDEDAAEYRQDEYLDEYLV